MRGLVVSYIKLSILVIEDACIDDDDNDDDDDDDDDDW